MDNKWLSPALKGFSVILILAGLGTLYNNFTSRSVEVDDLPDSQKVNARVIDKVVEKTGDETHYKLVLEYKTKNSAQSFSPTRVVDKSYFERVDKGGILQVITTPKDPYAVIIPDSRESKTDVLNVRFFVGLVLLSMSVGVWLFAGKRKSA